MANKTIPQLTAALLPVDPLSLIEISIPGGGSRKLALSALGFPILLASGTISSPVATLDLLLPAGYVDFEIKLIGVQVDESGEDSLNFRFSFDGGVTFSIDANYFTHELYAAHDQDPKVNTTGGTGTSSGEIANGYPSQIQTPGESLCCNINLFPGTASLYPSLTTLAVTNLLGTPDHFNWLSSIAVYNVVGRANAIRFFTQGAGIAKGTYFLYGRLAP